MTPTFRCTLALLLAALAAACAREPVVEVGGESLRGEHLADNGVFVFRGVPFAEPPVGELRWRAPQPLATKQPQRDVTGFAPACMQSMRILEWYRDMAEIFGAPREVMEDLAISEDCLYLNVWSPELGEDANLPVMVYVHGGSNKSGWSFEPNYHGHVFASRRVVAVSVAYRMGPFGFFSHPDLAADDGVANFGLLDLIAALEWIQRNIALFGGDPDRVMVFGESAGAQNILALMASRRADGLLHRAILQSTAGFGVGNHGSPSLADERQRGDVTAGLFGFGGADAISKLRSVPADELLARYEEHFADYYHSPAVDGAVLEEPVWDAIRGARLAGVPLIMGTNADEWYSSAPESAIEDDIFDAVASSQFLQSTAALDAVRTEPDSREAIDRILTADSMLCPSQYTAARQSDLNANAWIYLFSRVREGDAGASVRAYHGAELPYVFGTHDPWMTTTIVDRRLSEQMIAHWVQFARTGDPNAADLPPWPAFASPGYRVMEFSDEPAVIDAPEPVLCRVFREAVDNGRGQRFTGGDR